MKIQLEQSDLEMIAAKVADYLKPLIAGTQKAKHDDEFISVEEAAALLKTSKGQIYQWVDNAQHGLGDFPYLKAGRLLRFSKNELIQWLKSRKSPKMR